MPICVLAADVRRSARRHNVRMAPVQPPRVPFFLPDVREPAANGLTRDEARTRYVGARNHGFESHEDTKVAVNAHELNRPLERREVDDATPNELVEVLLSSNDHLVVRRI